MTLEQYLNSEQVFDFTLGDVISHKTNPLTSYNQYLVSIDYFTYPFPTNPNWKDMLKSNIIISNFGLYPHIARSLTWDEFLHNFAYLGRADEWEISNNLLGNGIFERERKVNFYWYKRKKWQK